MTIFGIAKFVLLTHFIGSMVSLGIMLLRFKRTEDYTPLQIYPRLIVLCLCIGWLYTIDVIMFWMNKRRKG